MFHSIGILHSRYVSRTTRTSHPHKCKHRHLHKHKHEPAQTLARSSSSFFRTDLFSFFSCFLASASVSASASARRVAVIGNLQLTTCTFLDIVACVAAFDSVRGTLGAVYAVDVQSARYVSPALSLPVCLRNTDGIYIFWKTIGRWTLDGQRYRRYGSQQRALP
jgi:hypothetical protein